LKHELPKTNIHIPMPKCKSPKELNTCTYTLVYDDRNTWECSNCRHWWIFSSGTPEDNQMKYCPMCGTKIIENKIESFITCEIRDIELSIGYEVNQNIIVRKVRELINKYTNCTNKSPTKVIIAKWIAYKSFGIKENFLIFGIPVEYSDDYNSISVR